MRWYLIVYQEMLSAFALIFMTIFRLYFSITMFGATRNLNCSYTNIMDNRKKKCKEIQIRAFICIAHFQVLKPFILTLIYVIEYLLYYTVIDFKRGQNMNSLQLTNVKMLPDAAPSVPTIHIHVLPSTQVNDCFVITFI